MPDHGVTIAIPNWNHELLLPRSIGSALRAVAVLREQGTDGEVLVIDDCSRDGSRALLRQLEPLYFNDGLRVAALQANGGLAAARNHALAHGRYRYIAFMDADNEIVPENLPTFLRAVTQTGAAAVYGNLLVRQAAADCAQGVLSNESFQSRMFREVGNYIDAFALFDSVQVRDVGGYDSLCSAHEDYELWLHLACEGRRVLFVPQVFGYYYSLPGSMICVDYEKHLKTNAKVKRVFNQLNAREQLPLNTELLRYHPDIGYL
ncbi:MAG: glycosyltransferase [Gemmataceae bacterium]|nr:glycosyltransferase [Gemmataceae bacterium]